MVRYHVPSARPEAKRKAGFGELRWLLSKIFTSSLIYSIFQLKTALFLIFAREKRSAECAAVGCPEGTSPLSGFAAVCHSRHPIKKSLIADAPVNDIRRSCLRKDPVFPRAQVGQRGLCLIFALQVERNGRPHFTPVKYSELGFCLSQRCGTDSIQTLCGRYRQPGHKHRTQPKANTAWACRRF